MIRYHIGQPISDRMGNQMGQHKRTLNVCAMDSLIHKQQVIKSDYYYYYYMKCRRNSLIIE